MKNNTTPLVSIVVPAYNVELYYSRAIESMINQSYKNIEILLIDDGSKDDSGKIADSYAQKDTRVISIHQKNAGVSIARNTGIDKAKGEYVTFVDPDDYLESNAIEAMVNTIMEQKVDVVRTRCKTFRNNRKIEKNYGITPGLYTGKKLEALAFRAALHQPYDAISCCWLLLIKKRVLDAQNLRFADGIIIMQDTWFYVDLLRNIRSLYSSDAVTYNYMINNEGTISSKTRFAEKITSIINLYHYLAVTWKDDIDKSERLRTQYGVLIATRTINSSKVSMKQTRELLKVTSQYNNLFQGANTKGLSPRHKLYTFAVRRNKAFFVVLLTLARNVAIFIKG